MTHGKKNKCSHGYPIEGDKIPYTRTRYRIEACKKCAIASALSQMSFSLDNVEEEDLEKLKELIIDIKKEVE